MCFFLQVIFSKIQIFDMICPFGFAFAIVRVFYGGNIFAIIFSYVISKIYVFSFFSDVFICFYEIVIISLYYFLRYTKLNNKPLLLLIFMSVISAALQFYYVLLYHSSITLFFCEFALKIIFLIFFYRFFAIFKNKFLFFKFSNLDYLYFSLISMFITMGIYSFPFQMIKLEFLFVAIIVVFACKIFLR